jgi:hypothetical protein
MREKFSVQSAQKLYNATLVEHQTVLVQLSVAGSHGAFVVEEELEVGL